MRYKLKEKPKPKPTEIIGRKGPELGDKKSVTKFAYLPKRINGYMVWLESYTLNYVFKEVTRSMRVPMYKGVPTNYGRFTELDFFTTNDWKIDNIELKK